MIPKVIHYCWFGKQPLPKRVVKCIDSWKRFLPGFTIKHWNEDNFDVNQYPYAAQAYAKGKYAFVSDVARFHALYNEGGIYFDTDVELIRPIDDILLRGAFLGVETPSINGSYPRVAAGLGCAFEKGHPIVKEMLDRYTVATFADEETVVEKLTYLLRDYGLQPINDVYQIAGVWIYPKDYFCPLDDLTGRMHKTNNTRSIHWYDKTWVDNYGPVRTYFTRLLHRVIGVNASQKLKKICPR
ncbi:MAG: glycosyltransferase [Bacteroidales bacterium]|nr:glycosyltransferase [Bacteroidales bacterium]